MSITKAIIPTGGWGTRRLPITKAIEKSMLPIGNRPLIDYPVQELIAAGIKEIYIVISSTEPSQIRNFYSENPSLTHYLTSHGKLSALKQTQTIPDDVTIHYVIQSPAFGYGTAIPIAITVEQYNLNEPLLVYMGDDFIWNPSGASSAESLLSICQSSTESAILGVEVPRAEVVSKGVLSVSDGLLTHIVEKPSLEEAPSNLINVSKYLMSPPLLQEIVTYVKTHHFGPTDQEYLVTDPITTYLQHGGIMRVASTTGTYLDGGTLEGWLHANRVVFDQP